MKPRKKSSSSRKRLARQEDREYAAEIARCIREQIPIVHSINAQGDPVLRTLHSSDFASVFEFFASHGTFQEPRSSLARFAEGIKAEYEHRRSRGEAQFDAMAAIAKRMGVSEDRINDVLFRRVSVPEQTWYGLSPTMLYLTLRRGLRIRRSQRGPFPSEENGPTVVE